LGEEDSPNDLDLCLSAEGNYTAHLYASYEKRSLAADYQDDLEGARLG